MKLVTKVCSFMELKVQKANEAAPEVKKKLAGWVPHTSSQPFVTDPARFHIWMRMPSHSPALRTLALPGVEIWSCAIHQSICVHTERKYLCAYRESICVHTERIEGIWERVRARGTPAGNPGHLFSTNNRGRPKNLDRQNLLATKCWQMAQFKTPFTKELGTEFFLSL